MGAREYDPRTARWLQKDPIDVASGDPNLYRYCGNDPINFADDGNIDWSKVKKQLHSFYWRDVAALGQWIDANIFGGATEAFGNIAGECDSGRASGWQVLWAAANWGWELDTSARQFARFSLSTLVGAGVRELAGRGGREVVRKGRVGEIAAGIERQQRVRISGAYITTKSKTRIPDLVDGKKRRVVEVKNVRQLSMTRQLREYLMWAEENGYTLELRTRMDTRLSSELERLIQSGKIKHNSCIR